MTNTTKKIESVIVTSIRIVPGRSIVNYWRAEMLIINEKYIDMNEHRAYWGSKIGQRAEFVNTGTDGGYIWAKSPGSAFVTH